MNITEKFYADENEDNIEDPDPDEIEDVDLDENLKEDEPRL